MKLLVLDGNSIVNRAFYGIRPLTTKDGLHTNAIYGFMNILAKLREDTRPDAVAVAFDLAAPTFRHLAFEGYKAGRKAMPEELAMQMPVLKELLDRMGIARLETEGFEADDILGTQASACETAGNECVIATGDRDSLQLISEKVTVLLAATKGGRPETTLYDVAKIKEVYGVTPPQMIEVKALMGDASDRIPGVPGIGEKTALDLVARFSTVEALYQQLDTADIKPGVRTKLAAGHESALMSRELATIRRDAPVETDIGKLRPAMPDEGEFYRLLARLEFYSMIKKMGLHPVGASAADADGQTALSELKIETAADTDALFARLAQAGAADFCAVYEAGGMAACAFGFDDGVTVALPEKTAGFASIPARLAGDGALRLRTHDVKRFIACCLETGIDVGLLDMAGRVDDTLLAGYVLNPLASSYEPTRLCDEMKVALPAVDSGFGLMEDVVACAKNALAVHLLAGKMDEVIERNGQTKLYREIELPLAHVLAMMEHAGFRVDAAGIEAYGQKLAQQLAAMQEQIYGMVGYEFNINSTKQLGDALFIKLGLPPKKRTKTGFSTDAEVLEELKSTHPVIGVLLEFRQLSKLKSTYTDGLLKVIGPDGRIHSNFNQVETRTGRISSTEPNLQNIPVRSEAGRELRRFFIPAEGCILIDADYSQIELRILAHIANDQAMIEAFNSHVDIHTLTASQVFNMPLEFVTPLMRSRAKAVNFGIVYGISAFSLSQDIGVTVREADSYIKGYLSTFSGVRNYMEQVIKQAYERGYVETLLGRRRSLPELAGSNHNIRMFGERVARNTPIQGTAADVIKIAMVHVCDRLRREGLKSRLILQVHDELIVEAPQEEAIIASQILKEEMENAVPMVVKLEADVHGGSSWYDAKA